MDTLYCKLSINHMMDVQYQRYTYGNGATLLFFKVLALGYRCMDVHMYRQSHDNQIFLDQWFINFFEICGSSCVPLACRSSAIHSHLIYIINNFILIMFSYFPISWKSCCPRFELVKSQGCSDVFLNILNFAIILIMLGYFIGKEKLHFDDQSLPVVFLFWSQCVF